MRWSASALKCGKLRLRSSSADGSHTIRRHYEALHDAGVIHNDVSWRHILRRPDESDLWIVDFDRAIARSNEDDIEWYRRCASEMEQVDVLLAEGAFPQ